MLTPLFSSDYKAFKSYLISVVEEGGLQFLALPGEELLGKEERQCARADLISSTRLHLSSNYSRICFATLFKKCATFGRISLPSSRLATAL